MNVSLRGKYNTAEVFTDNVDSKTISQIIELCNQEFVKDSQIRIMPDCHAGKGCVVGTTMTLTDKVVPNMVGIDIGCNMLATRLEETDIDLKKLDQIVNTKVPSGADIHERPVAKFSDIKRLIAPVNILKARCSIGSLGGGNHFIEIDRDKNGDLWLVIHSGSRHLGIEVCNHYQKRAISVLRKEYISPKIKDAVARLKAEGKEYDIENTVKIIKMQPQPIPDALCYVSGNDFRDYIHDMEIVQRYAVRNCQTMAEIIIDAMGYHVADQFDTIHNYIDIDNMILRKGSISAQKGERVIIPMNMRDGSLICIGKGNPDWNYSAPHGAGRIMSRSKAKESVDFDVFKESMKGIYSTSVTESTISEAPMVYKPMDEIMENIKDTVDVIDAIKPVYNFKSH